MTTQQPLWKVLNEARTRGDWTNDNLQVCTGIEATDETIFDGQYKGEYPSVWERNMNEAKANAAYAALAVNNLHILAEALEKCKDWFYLNGKRFKLPLDGSPGTPACFHSIEEALNRIS